MDRYRQLLAQTIPPDFAVPEGQKAALANCWGTAVSYKAAETWLVHYFRRLHKHCGAAGDPYANGRVCVFSIHAFRRGYINRMFRQGLSVPDVAQIVGHSSFNTTLGYARKCGNVADFRRELSRLD